MYGDQKSHAKTNSGKKSAKLRALRCFMDYMGHVGTRVAWVQQLRGLSGSRDLIEFQCGSINFWWGFKICSVSEIWRGSQTWWGSKTRRGSKF